MVAQQAGYTVSGSDKQDSLYTDYLKQHGVSNVHIGQTAEAIAAVHERTPIDWYVYSSAVSIEQPNAPEFVFCREQNIHMSKRDELLNRILADKEMQLVAVAGTHGKTTTTAMAVWLLKQLGVPIGYILPAKSSFADMGAYRPGAQYFVYECDEFDRNFLNFEPALSLISGIDWDHPDIYPTREDYNAAFREFLEQSQQTYLWEADAEQLGVAESESYHVLRYDDYADLLHLPGAVNRWDGALVAEGFKALLGKDSVAELAKILDAFPGVSRRFEQIVPGLYSDYAHTPAKIRGALQLAQEVAAGSEVVVVYEGLHNTRQHFIRAELHDLFEGVSKLYIVPSYLAREDESLKLLTPDDLKLLLNNDIQTVTEAAALDASLHSALLDHLQNGSTVLCLTAGGGGSLDEWLRQEFKTHSPLRSF